MRHNHLRVSLRHLRRTPAFAFIIVTGLAIGMAASLLLSLYVQDELHYDQSYAHADRLFRIVQPEDAYTPPRLAPALAEAFPGVEAAARVLPTLGDVLIKGPDDRSFYEGRFYYADASAMGLFSVPLLQGDAATALDGTNRLVISETTAHRYFGDADAIGQSLVFDVGFEVPFTITGIMRDPPHDAHFRPDFLASMDTFAAFNMLDMESWQQSYFLTYVRLAPSLDPDTLAAALPAFVAARAPEAQPSYPVQAVSDIHLHSHLRHELEAPGTVGYVYALSAIAVLILAIACINFVNLATARSARRTKEVGVRKVLGARRSALVRQYLAESTLMALMAAVLALGLVMLVLPWFDALVGKPLALVGPRLVLALALLLGMTVLAGLGAGIYPALFLARRTPMAALHGPARQTRAGLSVRRLLVVGQFTAGIVLMACTVVVRQQLEYVRHSDLGFDEEQTLVVAARMYGHAATPLPFDAMVRAFEQHPAIQRVAATGDVPGTAPPQANFLLEGQTPGEVLSEHRWDLFSVDYGLLQTLGIDVVKGRTFSRASPSDVGDAFLLNETAARAAVDRLGAGWKDPIGKRLDRYVRADGEWVLARPGHVVGVVRDFHYQSLRDRIAPLVIQLNPRIRDHFVVRLSTSDVSGALAYLEKTWRAFAPGRPFEYYFLDDAFDGLYRAEQRMGTLFAVFTALSLAIACLGLFALSAYMAEQRTKEVGVRKVLGAGIHSIVLLLSRDVTRLILVAAVVACPLAYLLMRMWLEGYAYRITLGPGAFLLAAVGAIGIAWLTVSYQAVKAALANPVNSLRHE